MLETNIIGKIIEPVWNDYLLCSFESTITFCSVALILIPYTLFGIRTYNIEAKRRKGKFSKKFSTRHFFQSKSQIYKASEN